MAIAFKLIFVYQKPFQTHRAARMYFVGADTYFRAEPIPEPIAESG
jgi:hypothetical protein